MKMVNKVFLLGNLGKDPEIRQLESGTKVARFPLATHESFKDKSGEWQQRTEWHNIVLWSSLAERAERQLHKGSTIFLEGKIGTRKWQDSNGQDRYTTEITGLMFRVLDKRENSEYSGSPENNNTNNVVNPSSEENNNLNENDQIDDLPF
ncbi:MAG TPA: single-stranded DNA-binding protein [Bacteroidetes bacterium]|nr:single-stranded DNA-binding protein [Bacteroidota bacterium]